MDNSILNTTKKLLGISPEDQSFDTDIIIHINSAILSLIQNGVGPSTGFYIQDDTKKWSDYISDTFIAEAAKTFVYIKVKLVFDPPTNAVLHEALTRSAAENEWRLREWAEERKQTIV